LFTYLVLVMALGQLDAVFT